MSDQAIQILSTSRTLAQLYHYTKNYNENNRLPHRELNYFLLYESGFSSRDK